MWHNKEFAIENINIQRWSHSTISVESGFCLGSANALTTITSVYVGHNYTCIAIGPHKLIKKIQTLFDFPVDEHKILEVYNNMDSKNEFSACFIYNNNATCLGSGTFTYFHDNAKMHINNKTLKLLDTSAIILTNIENYMVPKLTDVPDLIYTAIDNDINTNVVFSVIKYDAKKLHGLSYQMEFIPMIPVNYPNMNWFERYKNDLYGSGLNDFNVIYNDNAIAKQRMMTNINKLKNVYLNELSTKIKNKSTRGMDFYSNFLLEYMLRDQMIICNVLTKKENGPPKNLTTDADHRDAFRVALNLSMF